MSKLVIGCGYLGRRVARAWLEEGANVAALTRSPRNAEQFRQQGIEPVVGDVLDRDSLTALPDAQTVLYSIGYDRTAGNSQRDVYVTGLENVLDEVSSRAPPGGWSGRLIYISSTSVYGQTRGEWIDETSPCQPTRDNGRVCLEAEQVVRRYFPPDQATREHGAIVLRLAGLYGPGRLLRRLEELKSGRAISGNPDAYLNLIQVDDAARAVLACARCGRTGSTYLVCDDRPITRREYYERLASLTGAPSPVFESDDEGSQGHVSITLNKRCSNRLIHEELGVALRFPTIDVGLPHALSEASRH